MAEGRIENVSDTAFWVAHYRAVESERSDALFHDRFARLLAGERGEKIAQAMPFPGMTRWIIAIRTAIIDDYIRAAIAGGVETVLNLGAGLDARPYRMDLPASVTWIEADYPQMIEFKEQRLAAETPKCRLERVRIDLGDVAERRELFSAVNARAKKLLVLTEGVIPYLTNEQVGELAGDLHGLDRVAYWIAEYHSPRVQKYRQRSALTKKLENAPFRFVPADWFGFFAERGWRAKEIRYLAEEAERLGRPIELPLVARAIMTVRGIFASKAQRAEFKKFSAYVLLKPVTLGV